MHNPAAMVAMLREARARKYRAVFLVKPSQINRSDILELVKNRDKVLLVQQDDASLLGSAYGWQQAEGGVEIWTTLHGVLERLG
ncbi:MAG: hypothetical protein ACPGSE_00465 [Synechococcus sp.]